MHGLQGNHVQILYDDPGLTLTYFTVRSSFGHIFLYSYAYIRPIVRCAFTEPMARWFTVPLVWCVLKKRIISALDAGYHPVSLLDKCIWPGTYDYLLKVNGEPEKLYMERMNIRGSVKNN